MFDFNFRISVFNEEPVRVEQNARQHQEERRTRPGSVSVAYRVARAEDQAEVEALRSQEVMLGPQQGHPRLRRRSD